MAVAMLIESGQIKAESLPDYGLIGELSLNGNLRPTNGMLAPNHALETARPFRAPHHNASLNFPRRNALIAALSDELHVIDAGRNSGAMITAEYAKKYGKRVRKQDDPDV